MMRMVGLYRARETRLEETSMRRP